MKIVFKFTRYFGRGFNTYLQVLVDTVGTLANFCAKVRQGGLKTINSYHFL